MKKLISRKGIVLILIPFFVIFLQAFIRYVLGKDFNTIGITLGALGLGQILPFVYFDHFVANKIFNISPSFAAKGDKFIITYKAGVKVGIEDIEGMKNLTYVAIFVNLMLFVMTVYFGLIQLTLLHIISGSLCCLLSWGVIFYKS
ncbi:MAG: hypothetical protein AAB316_09445 [Bacteroidota bacterium]